MDVEQKHRRLHIGGLIKADGWEILDDDPAPYVDHICNANDLSQFADNTFIEIYASHVLEHFDYVDELKNTLQEWYRVLAPGGKLYISVPDLDVLAALFLDRENLTIDDRFWVVRMIFGGHTSKYDYHYAGLNEEFLHGLLDGLGFVNIKKVQEFGIFDDTSSMIFKGKAISLNMTAEKRRAPETTAEQVK